MINILAISGSLRAASSNTAILKTVMQLAPAHVNISVYRELETLPYFNPDIDNDNNAIASVIDWRLQLKNADAVIFCTPEYAHGIPGVLKNALDWIVSSGEFMNKPTAVISASPSIEGGYKANASLVQTLKVMMAKIDENTILCIPTISAKLNTSNEIADPTTKQALYHLIDNIVSSVRT